MADLMTSMNDDIHLTSTPKKPSSSCDVCQEDFDYRDEVKTAGNKVKEFFFCIPMFTKLMKKF